MNNDVIRQGPTLWEQVYELLEHRILTHVIPPGARLVETEIAETFGISRNPVREAIRALEREGWVEKRESGAGVEVPLTGGESGEAVFEARRILEAETTALAAERRTKSDLGDLAGIVASGWQALSLGDSAKVAELNSDFHARISAATCNPVLANIQNRLDKRTRWHFTTIATVRGGDSWREHQDILHALEQGDADVARSLARKHVERSFKALSRETIKMSSHPQT